MLRYFIAGNYWLSFALLLFLGQKWERNSPIRYSFFGVGSTLSPTTYTLMILLTIGLAAMSFGLMWVTRTRRDGTTKEYSRADAEFEDSPVGR